MRDNGRLIEQRNFGLSREREKWRDKMLAGKFFANVENMNIAFNSFRAFKCLKYAGSFADTLY